MTMRNKSLGPNVTSVKNAPRQQIPNGNERISPGINYGRVGPVKMNHDAGTGGSKFIVS